MSKRRLVITAVLAGGSQSEVARTYGVSQPWISRLMARYLLEGEAAFEPRSRRRKRPSVCGHTGRSSGRQPNFGTLLRSPASQAAEAGCPEPALARKRLILSTLERFVYNNARR